TLDKKVLNIAPVNAKNENNKRKKVPILPIESAKYWLSWYPKFPPIKRLVDWKKYPKKIEPQTKATIEIFNVLLKESKALPVRI
ncbi:MAG: hypothetical protein ACPGVD_09680, partial [Flavobacteriales bacterium]